DTNPIYKTEPRLIVEVQSDWKRDQFEKRFVYQQVDSLEEYLIIDPESEAPKAWLYQRSRDWADRVLVPPESVLLESIDLELSFDQIYESL
ncbi:MAG: Uma2 family endonuclease, partial [Verrucomicrobiota bacterium]